MKKPFNFDTWFKFIVAANVLIALFVIVAMGFMGCMAYRVYRSGPPPVRIQIEEKK